MATACSFFDTPLKRAGAWALGYALARLLLSAFSPVPYTLPLDPLALCLAGVFSAAERKQLPAFLVILAAGQVAGDLAAGMTAACGSLRLLGLLLLSGSAPRGKDGLTLALFLASTHAAWSALAPEFRGEFPFPYIYGVTLLQSLLWIGLLTPLLPKDEFRPGRAMLWILAVPGAVFALWLLFAPTPLWPPPSLGSFGGIWIRIGAVLLVLSPLMPQAFLLLRKQPSSSGGPRPSRWRDLVD